MFRKMTIALIGAMPLLFCMSNSSFAQTVLRECPCSLTYYPQKSYEGEAQDEAGAKANAWSTFGVDANFGFKQWYEGLKTAAPKCDERCTPSDLSGPGPLTLNQDVQSIGTPQIPRFKATLTWQTTMTVTCGTPRPQKHWF